MPIKGITDKRRMNRLGKLHLGVKLPSAKGGVYPKAVDYFVCTSDSSTPEDVAVNFKKFYGDQPKTLSVVFPTDNPEQIFSQWYKRYGQSKGLICKGDGETASEVQSNGEMKERTCPCVHLTGDEKTGVKKTCRMVANLQFMLPDVEGIGVFQIDTSSYNSIININSAIDMVKNLCGKIAGIPLQLVVLPQEAQVAGAKKTIYVLNLKLNESLLQLMERQKKLKGSGDDTGLLPPSDEKPEDLFPEGESVEVEETVQPATQAATTPANVQPPINTGTTPPASKPADVSLDDLLTPDDKPAIPLCEKCQHPMILKKGVVNKVNVKTGKPYGYVEAWACLGCKILNLPK